MRQFLLVGSPAEPENCAPPASRAWFFVDAIMTLLVIGLTTMFVRMLAWSLP